MFEQFTQFIRDISGNRSRPEWKELSQTTISTLRNWLSDNGEVAAAAGFVIGIFLVLMFEFVVVLLVVLGLVAYFVWFLSSPDADLKMQVIKEVKSELANSKSGKSGSDPNESAAEDSEK